LWIVVWKTSPNRKKPQASSDCKKNGQCTICYQKHAVEEYLGFLIDPWRMLQCNSTRRSGLCEKLSFGVTPINLVYGARSAR
jgi:hypothetical protein